MATPTNSDGLSAEERTATKDVHAGSPTVITVGPMSSARVPGGVAHELPADLRGRSIHVFSWIVVQRLQSSSACQRA